MKYLLTVTRIEDNPEAGNVIYESRSSRITAGQFIKTEVLRVEMTPEQWAGTAAEAFEKIANTLKCS